MKDKAKNVLRYYVLSNTLKNLIRKGWLDWKLKSDRIESVAEHVYGSLMLAIAMKSEYDYDIDLEKVLVMLAVHETEEIIIGDLTLYDIGREEKENLGHEAVEKIFSSLVDKKKYKKLIFEFDERKTKEAKFAFFCDKLECDLQARIYDLKGCMKIGHVKRNKLYKKKEEIKSLVDKGLTWGQMWLRFGWGRYDYDENFLAVSKCAFHEDVLNLGKID